MSKIHGLIGSTDFLTIYDDPAITAVDDGLMEMSAVSAAVSLATSPVLTQVLYLTEPGESGAINVADINQGQMGDCFLLSSIGEIVLLKPAFISDMIHANANGTETVTLYEASSGRLPTANTTAFKSVSETVTNVFPNYSVNNGASQDVVNGQKEIWPQVIENAVATLGGGYASIANGGSPVVAMEELTGHTASFMSAASLTLATLQNFVKADDLIVMDTLQSGALPNGLFNDHAYMFSSVTGSGASAMVHLLNPWGFDQPTAMLVSQLSHGFSEVDIGHMA
jgi:hypothetical protein